MVTRLYLPGVLNDLTRPVLSDAEIEALGPLADVIMRMSLTKTDSGEGEYVGRQWMGAEAYFPQFPLYYISDPLGGVPIREWYIDKLIETYSQYISSMHARMVGKAIDPFWGVEGYLRLGFVSNGVTPWGVRDPFVGWFGTIHDMADIAGGATGTYQNWTADRGNWRFNPQQYTGTYHEDTNSWTYATDLDDHYRDLIYGPIWPGLRLVAAVGAIETVVDYSPDEPPAATPVLYPSDSGDDLPDDAPAAMEHGASWLEVSADLVWQQQSSASLSARIGPGFSLSAWIKFDYRESSFSLSAYIVLDPGTGRWRHHRLRDHVGADRAINVVLDEQIGPYDEMMPVQFVLEDLYARMLMLESATKTVRSFSLEAIVAGPGDLVGPIPGTRIGGLSLNALLFATQSGVVSLDAFLQKGGRFTLDASIRGAGHFSLDAVIA